MKGKVPIWFDNRFGAIERAKHLKLCSYVARISTLRRGVKLTIPLNPARCHLGMLEQGTMKSFQLVKRDGKYYVHVKAEFHVPDQPVHAVRGIDLGVKRSIASVMLRPNQPLRSSDFTIRQDGLKRDRLNRLEKQIAELQQARKCAPLKRIRHKRLHVSEQYDTCSKTSCHNFTEQPRSSWPSERYQIRESERKRETPSAEETCFLGLWTNGSIHPTGVHETRHTHGSTKRTLVK